MHRQRGVAMVTAMLIVAMVVLLSFSLLYQQTIDVRRSSNILHRYQAYMFAEGAEGWAKRVLEEDAKQGARDHKLEQWNLALPPMEVENGVIGAQIRDHSGCFNLNNLVLQGVASSEDLARFRRLLAALGLPEGLADATVDWLDLDAQVTFPDGAESEHYARLEPPYAIANQPLLSSSELRAIHGYNPAVVEKLLPYVCALPGRSKINLNFAEFPVLISALPGLSQADAEGIVEVRDQPQQGIATRSGFESMQEFYDLPAVKSILDNHSGLQAQIEAAFGLSSRFYLLLSEAQFQNSSVVVYSLLERDGNKITTHYRAQGSY